MRTPTYLTNLGRSDQARYRHAAHPGREPRTPRSSATCASPGSTDGTAHHLDLAHAPRAGPGLGQRLGRPTHRRPRPSRASTRSRAGSTSRQRGDGARPGRGGAAMNRRAPLIAGIAIAAVAALLVLFLVLPKMGEVGDAQDQLVAGGGPGARAAGAAPGAAAGGGRGTRDRAPDRSDREQIPPTADLPELFTLLQGAADRSGVDFFSFSPGTPTAARPGSSRSSRPRSPSRAATSRSTSSCS